jgi:hypothetical protein
MLNGYPGGSVYKGAVRMTRAGECLIMAMDRG